MRKKDIFACGYKYLFAVELWGFGRMRSLPEGQTSKEPGPICVAPDSHPYKGLKRSTMLMKRSSVDGRAYHPRSFGENRQGVFEPKSTSERRASPRYLIVTNTCGASVYLNFFVSLFLIMVMKIIEMLQRCAAFFQYNSSKCT